MEWSYDYLFHTPNPAIHQADLDAMRMRGRMGQEVFDHAFSQLSGRLVLLQDNPDPQTRCELGTRGNRHDSHPSKNY